MPALLTSTSMCPVMPTATSTSWRAVVVAGDVAAARARPGPARPPCRRAPWRAPRAGRAAGRLRPPWRRQRTASGRSPHRARTRPRSRSRPCRCRSKRRAHVVRPSVDRRPAAVDGDDRAGRVARAVAGEVDAPCRPPPRAGPSRPAGSRSTTLPTNSSSQSPAMSVANAPGITQLTRTCGRVLLGERHRQRVEAVLRRGVHRLGRARSHRTDAGDVHDRATAGRGHARAGDGHQPERSLEVDLDGLVEERLGDALERGRQGRDARVVDQDVEPSELDVDLLDRRLDGRPSCPTCRASGTAATPVALVIASAAAWHDSAFRLETTTVAPASASPRAIA